MLNKFQGDFQECSGLRLGAHEGMEKKMETGLEFLRHRKENGTYYTGLYRDSYKDPLFIPS